MAGSARRKASQTTQVASLLAPVGGWNAQDPIANMAPEFAVALDNLIPRPGYVEVRRGSADVVTDFAADVQTLFVWSGASSGVDKLFACAGGSIYDANTPGSVGAALVSGLASNRWKYVNFANTGGNYVIAVDGADTPLKYDGSSWSTTTITGSGLTATDLNDVMLYQQRLFFSEAGTTSVWYLDVQAIAGAALELPLGSYFTLGGSIVAMGAWTTDGGMGPNDQAVFVTSQGQVAVFTGTDPSDADNWSLVGVYTLGAPLGDRSLLQYGADLVLLTHNGVLPMSQAARFDRAQDNNVALTSKIQNAFAMATHAYGGNLGWEAFLYPAGQIAIYNVPITQLGTSYQYVQNVQTGAWCRFLGMNALCWAYANGTAYFGTADSVAQFDIGSQDLGQSITCDLTGAFSPMGNAHALKQFTMIRPIMQVASNTIVSVDVLADYVSAAPSNTPNFQQVGSGMIWGSMVWGSMVWGTGISIRKDWTGASGLGYVGAPRLRVVLDSAAEQSLQLIGFNVMYNEGAAGF